MVNTHRPLKREVATGRIIGDTASANGKVFAAFKTGAERDEILAAPHPQLTLHTIYRPEALAEELDRVANEEVAFDIEERNIVPALLLLRCVTRWAKSLPPFAS
jgi:DNA-binding IclR family transcriptional regulator